jgi:CheY-like chemotaxis protein
MGWNWNDTAVALDPARPPGYESLRWAEPGCRSVLVVEDSHEDRALLTAALRARGYAVEAVSSVAEALDVLDTGDAPRILLVDWVMPDLSGLELVEVLRRRVGERSTYCIMTTGMSARRGARRAREAGVDQYLEKPLDYDEVHRLIGQGLHSIRLDDAKDATIISSSESTW